LRQWLRLKILGHGEVQVAWVKKNLNTIRRTSNQKSSRFFVLYGAVAQMVEHRTENPGVGSSILPRTTKKESKMKRDKSIKRKR
jgi:hypothetical protein